MLEYFNASTTFRVYSKCHLPLDNCSSWNLLHLFDHFLFLASTKFEQHYQLYTSRLLLTLRRTSTQPNRQLIDSQTARQTRQTDKQTGRQAVRQAGWKIDSQN